MSLESNRFFEFGVFKLDRVDRQLFRHGQPVPVSSKSMEVLLELVENAGRVIERSRLLKQVWPDADSAEGSLAVTISSLRKTLGDRPDGGPYIETLPRQGYRFAARVTSSIPGESSATDPAILGSGQASNAEAELVLEELSESDEGKNRFDASTVNSTASASGGFVGWVSLHKRTFAMSVGIVVAGVAIGYLYSVWRAPGGRSGVRRLAILPFRNLRPDTQTDFLGSSLADATTTRLRGFSSLIVRPSSYSEKYRDIDVDPKVAAGELNVDTLVTGTFLREGNNLRVTVQLIDVTQGEILSRFPFDTKYDRLATVQDQVAHNIIDRLQLNLSPAEAEQFRHQTTDDPLAYEHFLRGIDMYSRGEFLAAIPLLEKAVELDPNFAIAWAHLGRAYTASASFNLRGQVLLVKAQSAYEQALTLNPELVETAVFMANLLTDSNRVEQAVPLLRSVLQANPNVAEARWELGYAYRFAGMLHESIQECERARTIDPNVKRTSSAPNYYLYVGQYEKFLSSLPKDDAAFLVFYRGMGNYYLKRFDTAAADFDRAYQMEPQLYSRIGKVLSYAIKNQRSVALEVLRDVEREIEQKGVSDSEAIYKVAQAYAILAEKASALRVLRRSIETGFFCYDYLKTDPLTEGIRSEPEFNRLMEIARERHEKFQRDFF